MSVTLEAEHTQDLQQPYQNDKGRDICYFWGMNTLLLSPGTIKTTKKKTALVNVTR